jgi:hypothetical protein
MVVVGSVRRIDSVNMLDTLAALLQQRDKKTLFFRFFDWQAIQTTVWRFQQNGWQEQEHQAQCLAHGGADSGPEDYEQVDYCRDFHCHRGGFFRHLSARKAQVGKIAA